MVSDYSQAWSPPLCSDPTLRSTLPDGALVEAFIFPDTGRGLRVTRAVAKGEELLAVPLDDCWHAADARKCAELQPLLGSGAALSDFDASVLQLLLSRAGKTSVSELRKAHLAEMPSAYNSTLFWSDADMAELKGSPWQQLAERLAEEVSDEVLLVSESGIKSPEDALRALEAGANAVLIGEALMRAHDPSREIEAYLELEIS